MQRNIQAYSRVNIHFGQDQMIRCVDFLHENIILDKKKKIVRSVEYLH